MPTIEYIRECFRYESGRLYWRVRPRSHFKSDADCNTFNTRFSGKEAGCLGFLKRKPGKQRWVCIVNAKHILRYHIVYAMHHGFWLNQVDHKNRLPTDDRIENLRPATDSQNKANTAIRADNTSGYKGVSLDKRRNKWVAEITTDNKKQFLGSFDTPEDAHEAYKVAAKERFGQYAFTG